MPSIRLLALVAVPIAVACGGATPTSALPIVPPPTTGTPSPTPPSVPAGLNGTPGAFTKRTVRVGGVSYPYQVFVPKAYVHGQSWPVILYVHGSGERGTDGDKQISVCMGTAVQAMAATFPAIVVFPQVPAGESFPLATRYEIVYAALDSVLATHDADRTRISVTGFSMGGGMAYDIAYHNPTRFSALVPVAAAINDGGILGVATAPIGSAYATAAQTLKAMPTWIFHNANDPTISVTYVRNIVQALTDAGSTVVRYTESPTGGHDCGKVYSQQSLYDWLLAQHR